MYVDPEDELWIYLEVQVRFAGWQAHMREQVPSFAWIAHATIGDWGGWRSELQGIVDTQMLRVDDKRTLEAVRLLSKLSS